MESESVGSSDDEVTFSLRALFSGEYKTGRIALS
jgi:hypothetical protein